MKGVEKTRKIRIIGVPIDLGQSRRGVDMGPSALRYAGLDDRLRSLGYSVEDCGNIDVPVRDTLPKEGGISFLPAVIKACEAIYDAGKKAIHEGCFPIFLGGDHSIAVGTVGGATDNGENVGLIWIDAHGDFNTPETTPTGNIHGMPLAALCGLGSPELINVGRAGAKVHPQNVMTIGIRDLDLKEKIQMRASGVGIYTMREIDERGMAVVAHEALRRLTHCSRIHVSLDMDSLDPSFAPGVGTPVRGGLSYREAHLLMEIIADSGKACSLDVVEINPILDERNLTAKVGIELISSLLGQSIL